MQVLLSCDKGANHSGGVGCAVLMCATGRSAITCMEYMQSLRAIVYISEPERDSRSRVSHLQRLSQPRWTGMLHSRLEQVGLQDILQTGQHGAVH